SIQPNSLIAPTGLTPQQTHYSGVVGISFAGCGDLIDVDTAPRYPDAVVSAPAFGTARNTRTIAG
ncbi:hypothetical protein ACTGV6_10685, partial [Streptococcus suis]